MIILSVSDPQHNGVIAYANGGNLAAALNFANSDLAFRKADMFLGNFNGFNTYDIESPKKLRVLATTGDRRSPLAPDAPTFAEAGLAGRQSARLSAARAPLCRWPRARR